MITVIKKINANIKKNILYIFIINRKYIIIIVLDINLKLK
jgi:hypothetical protein